jgi:hypothetical protein
LPKNSSKPCPGWNYIVRLYQPRKEILDGTWKFPEAAVTQKESKSHSTMKAKTLIHLMVLLFPIPCLQAQDRTILPPPAPEFKGKIGATYKD